MSDFDRNSEEFRENVDMTPESDNRRNDESFDAYHITSNDGSEGAHLELDPGFPDDLSRSVKAILAEQDEEMIQEKEIGPGVGVDGKDGGLAESDVSLEPKVPIEKEKISGSEEPAVQDAFIESEKTAVQNEFIESEKSAEQDKFIDSEDPAERHFSEPLGTMMDGDMDRAAEPSLMQGRGLADDESADYHQTEEYSEYRYSTADAADNNIYASDKQPMSFQGQHGQTYVLGMDRIELQTHQGYHSPGASEAGGRQQAVRGTAAGSADAGSGGAGITASGNGGAGITASGSGGAGATVSGNGGAGMPPTGNDGSDFFDNERNFNNKKPGMGKRFVTLAASALVFGLIAGGVIWGINKLGAAPSNDTLLETTALQTAPQIADSEPQASSEPQTDESNIIPTEANSNAISEIDSVITQDVSDMVESVMPAMVSITNTYLYQNYNRYGSPMEVEGAGSGIIIGENETELLVLTNNHVVEDTTSLTVSFIDGATANAVIKGRDSEADLAVISIQLEELDSKTHSAIKAASLGNSDEMKLGESVVAIGNALGYGQSVTVGVVSALNREIEVEGQLMTLMQTDAAINFGNSGGALLNTRGEVIGVNVAKSTYNSAEGMGYAIPISSAEEIINDLMTQETRIPVTGDNAAYLGISGDAIDSTMAKEAGISSGIFIYSVVEGSPAAEAGLQEKDILVSFDGKDVASMEELKEIIQYYESGTEVVLEVQRQEAGSYRSTSISVTLGSKPAE